MAARGSHGFGDWKRRWIGQRRSRLRLGVDQVQLPQLGAQDRQIEKSKPRRQAMPRQEAVDESESKLGDPDCNPVTARWLLAKPVAKAVSRAGAISFFPDSVHVAERSEFLGCVPGIERELVDQP